MPPIPDTGWHAPTVFPDLSREPCISLDVEAYEPDWDTAGPGWARGSGYLVGVSIAVPSGGKWYFPMRHTVRPEDNMDPEAVLAWLRVTLGNPKQAKIGANLYYDIGRLQAEGVFVKGTLVDVQYAEALLEESSELALEVLAQKYLGEGKVTNHLYDWCRQYYGGKKDQRGNIYRAPPGLVGPYAEADADLPLRIAYMQYPQLVQEGLVELFQMECDLIPLLIKMRYAGVHVDLSRAEQVRDVLIDRNKVAAAKLKDIAGFNVEVNSSASVARAFKKEGIPFGTTTKGNPSFTKQFMESVDHPLAKTILEIRKNDKLRGTFIESYILNSNVNGFVYGMFHPLRGEGGGTRSGRFSSSMPNLQNIPARDPELAPLIRGMFIPDAGHPYWRKYDYSQIEYRNLIHFAVGPGSDEARAMFCANPDMDYHEMALDLVGPEAGWDISTKDLRKHWRKPIKGINFGLIYGMGVPKLTRSLGLTPEQGRALFAAYHKGVPFAKATMDLVSQEALQTGVVKTILGRKSRFDMWEPLNWDADTVPMTYEKAVAKYGVKGVRRAYSHKALNRKLQGSAADLMKKAMWICWKDGIFDATGVPRLTVHDELDFSDPGGLEPAFAEMKRVLESAIPLKIPVRADFEIGPDWGHVQEVQ